MVDDLSGCGDERLRYVKRGTISFSVSEAHEDTRFFYSSSYLIHFRGVFGEGVGYVFVDQLGVFDNALRPNGPAGIRYCCFQDYGIKIFTMDTRGSKIHGSREGSLLSGCTSAILVSPLLILILLQGSLRAGKIN